MLNKAISTPIAIGVIFILIILFGFGFFIYKNSNFVIDDKDGDLTLGEDDQKEDFNINLAVRSEYKKKIIIPEVGNEEEIKGRQVFIKFDTKSLIDERKLSYDCSNIHFTDSDSEEVPFWLEGDECYKEESIFWLNIPSTGPHEEKIIYIYYGNESVSPDSSFEKVFPKQNTPELTGGYFLGPLMMSKDFSGYGNDGGDYVGDYFIYYYDTPDRNWGHYFFNHWGYYGGSDKANFNVNSLDGTDFSQGTIEMWIRPYVIESDNYQKIISDSGGNIELGIQPDGDLYFYPALAASKNYNLIKKPLDEKKWAHLVVTWDFNEKNSIFYVNGEKKKNYIENVPIYWKEKINLGDQWNVGGFAYAGFIDGLRIYSRKLNDQEVADAYKYNAQELRNPEIKTEEEELILQEGYAANPLVDISIDEIPKTDKVIVTDHYANPAESYFEFQAYSYEGNKAYLIPKDKEDSSVIFGYPIHNDSYVGTPITANSPFLLTNIGLKLNDPSIVKELRVNLLYSECAGIYEGIGEKKSRSFSIIPVAYACGGCGSWTVGESKLSFIKERDGIYWYSLDDPILASRKTNIIQIRYWPNNKEGLFSLEIFDLIFQDEKGLFVRSQVQEDQYHYFEQPRSDAYYAYFAPSEKGRITFSQSGKNKDLVISFENQGTDTFTIDEDSFVSIRTLFGKYEKIKSINIRDQSGNIIYSFGIENIMKKTIGQIIIPSESFSTLLPLTNLENNKSYWITLGIQKTSDRAFPFNQDLRKIIHWTIGEDSYYYASEIWTDRALYKLDINAEGIFNIKKVDRKEIP